MRSTQKPILSKTDYERVSHAVYEHCRINLKADKQELVQSRLVKLVRRSKVDNFSDYLDHVLSDPSSSDFIQFIDCLSTNLTSFFREKQHFDYLQNVYIPQLISASDRSRPTRIRCWSAGCSSGEEPYSIAITLAESVPEIKTSNVRILASDISSRMVKTAHDGYYPEQRLQGVSPAILKKYFEARTETTGRHYLVRPHIRKLIACKQINLMASWPITIGLNFIFCRNVMIYFDKPTQQQLVNRFYDLLLPGGMLFIGHSESLSGIAHRFEYLSPTIYQKK